MPDDTDRHYAMGVLAAKGAMRNGTAFALMVEQAEEVLAKPDLKTICRKLRDDLILRGDLENGRSDDGKIVVSVSESIWNEFCAAIGDRA